MTRHVMVDWNSWLFGVSWDFSNILPENSINFFFGPITVAYTWESSAP